MEEYKGDQVARVLGIYTKLINGYLINKAEEAERYGVNERTIQRDIDEIRNHLENEAEDTGFINSVIYDRIKKGYRLEQIYRMKLTNSEVLAVFLFLIMSSLWRQCKMHRMEMLLVLLAILKLVEKMQLLGVMINIFTL